MTATATRDQAGKFAKAPAFSGPPLAGLFADLPGIAAIGCDFCPPGAVEPAETWAHEDAESFAGLWALAEDYGWVLVPHEAADGTLYLRRMGPHCRTRWREAWLRHEVDAPEMLPATFATVDIVRAAAMREAAIAAAAGMAPTRPAQEMFRCPRCEVVFDQPGVGHECAPGPVGATGADNRFLATLRRRRRERGPVTDTAVFAPLGELDAATAGHLAAFLAATTPDGGEPPAGTPGPEPHPSGPGGTPEEMDDPALDEHGDPVVRLVGDWKETGGGEKGGEAS